MAILGGAGNTAGSNPTGVGKGLNYIGDHAYAYSGSIASGGVGPNTTMLDFTTGGSYLVGWLTFSNDVDGAAAVAFDMSIDGSTVTLLQEDNSSTDRALKFYVLIPAYAHVVIKWGVSTSNNATATLVGRVYQ